MEERDFTEQIEIYCPICGSNSLNRDETGRISCDECDYSGIA